MAVSTENEEHDSLAEEDSDEAEDGEGEQQEQTMEEGEEEEEEEEEDAPVPGPSTQNGQREAIDPNDRKNIKHYYAAKARGEVR